MKYSTRRSISIALSVALVCNSVPVYSAGIGRASYVSPNTPSLVSDRLIVKFKANNLPMGLSVAQINSELRRPLSAQVMTTLQVATGVNIAESHAIANGAHVMLLPDGATATTLAQSIGAIAKLPNVEYVEEDRILTSQAVPNDTNYSLMWGMQPVSAVAGAAPGLTGSYGADFETAWNTTTGTTTAGAAIIVAVVDTGITAHPDIVGTAGVVAAGAGSNLVSSGYNFITDCRIRGTTSVGGCAAGTLAASAVVAASPDASDTGDYLTAADVATPFFTGLVASNSSWHGTHVAGTIAAIGNNATGVIGGAYTAKILPVRVLGKGGGYTSDIANGIMWAAGVHPSIYNPNPAKVINLSLGGAGACSATEQNAINAAVAAGTVVVVAAGNSNLDVANFSPANCNNVISVAAVAKDGSRAAYSNFSSPVTNTTNPTYITLAAQGGDQSLTGFDLGIGSTLNSGLTTPVAANYVYYQGTSMATPHVAATAALMLAHNPALTPADIKTILSSPASLTAFPSFTPSAAATALKNYTLFSCAIGNNCGAGILNAKLAVQNSLVPWTTTGSFDFGAVATFSTGNNKTITLTNSSATSVTPGAAVITGPDAGYFAVVSNTCNGVTIAPNGTCQITMNYSPITAAVHSATLTLPTTVAGVASAFSLTGTAGAPFTVVATTSGTLYVGKSATANLTFTNSNSRVIPTGVLTLSQPSIMAASSDNCSNITLASGASCTAVITVTPTAVGSFSGSISLGMSGGGTQTRVILTGTVAAAPSTSSSGGGGGGGCSIMPFGAQPDASLLLAMLAVAAYWLRRRVVNSRSAD